MKRAIGIIGYGNMGSAIAQRIKTRYRLLVFDKEKNKAQALSGIEVAVDNIDLVNRVDTVILAVKPQDFKIVLDEIKDYTKEKLIISIAAGITTGFIAGHLDKVRIIRVMPNMPARIGKAMTCLCKGRLASFLDLNFALKLFGYLGNTLVLNEEMMDAATAISGSGPAFWCDFIEDKPKEKWEDYSRDVFIPEFCSAAQGIGFSKTQAKLLVDTTVKGSLAMVETWNITPSELKKQIASKGGTTEAGLEVLHKGGSLEEAVKAAIRRAKELSGGQ